MRKRWKQRSRREKRALRQRRLARDRRMEELCRVALPRFADAVERARKGFHDLWLAVTPSHLKN